MAKRKEKMWFGCPSCGYRSKPDEVVNGFEVYKTEQKCSNCGTPTGMQFAPFVPKGGK